MSILEGFDTLPSHRHVKFMNDFVTSVQYIHFYASVVCNILYNVTVSYNCRCVNRWYVLTSKCYTEIVQWWQSLPPQKSDRKGGFFFCSSLSILVSHSYVHISVTVVQIYVSMNHAVICLCEMLLPCRYIMRVVLLIMVSSWYKISHCNYLFLWQLGVYSPVTVHHKCYSCVRSTI